MLIYSWPRLVGKHDVTYQQSHNRSLGPIGGALNARCACYRCEAYLIATGFGHSCRVQARTASICVERGGQFAFFKDYAGFKVRQVLANAGHHLKVRRV